MIYEYFCKNCGNHVEVKKSVDKYNEIGYCGYCGQILKKLLSSNILISYNKSKDVPYYCAGLGRIIRNSKHKKELLKQKNLIEVGNEDLKKYAKKLELEKEERRNKEWENIDTRS